MVESKVEENKNYIHTFCIAQTIYIGQFCWFCGFVVLWFCGSPEVKVFEDVFKLFVGMSNMYG